MSSCQSCSMPMKKDPKGGGTNADGTRSTEYCSYCYQDGQFTEPNITRDEMVAKVKTMMQEQMKLPGFVAGLFAKKIPKLKRWAP
ncbi:zinc ribbon domain-containing protein [Candidatus Bipolaricaulota bacterium]|nr:zinc ribbon domain-containing protein [Candidatus Bipolaricaulota bacterium]